MTTAWGARRKIMGMAIWTITGWQTGKKTRKGSPLPPDEMPPTETVTVVPLREGMSEFGCRTRTELDRWLRLQREMGRLVCERGRLTQRVQMANGRRRPCYVVRGTTIPRRRQRRTRMLYW